MFETLLESDRPRSTPTRQAAASFTLHAGALIGAVALSGVPSPPPASLPSRVLPIVYIAHTASLPVAEASHGHDRAARPSVQIVPAWKPGAVPSEMPAMPLRINADWVPASRAALHLLIDPEGGGRIDIKQALIGGDTPPELVITRPPVYPGGLMSSGVTGSVVLEFVVDSTGKFQESTLRVVTTDHPGFVEPARAALRASRFRAAQAGGRPVSAWVRQAVRFSLDSGRR